MMKPLFLYYPQCSTCRKAARWLADHGVEVEMRDIVQDRPTVDELTQWKMVGGFPIGKFFNTSGMLYRSMGLKGRLPFLTETEQLNLLASDGKMVRRPIVVARQGVLVGFREEEWSAFFLP